MLGACLLMWCLGQGAAPSERMTLMHDIHGGSRAERTVAYEFPWVIAGFIEQTEARNALFGGVLPVRLNVFNGYFSIESGAIVASAPVPGVGTRGNFMTRFQLRLTERLAVTYTHWSNASLGDRNPGVNSLGVSVRVRTR
jgi:Lipid A 3-O-deacylase (PagL)